MSYQTILAIGSGGFIGSVLRVYLIGLVNAKMPHDIPLGTVSVNLLGSFLIGVLFALFYHTTYFTPQLKSFLTAGILGGFTTFSTFAIESVFLLQVSLLNSAIYLMLNVAGSILFAFLGYKIVNMVYL